MTDMAVIHQNVPEPETTFTAEIKCRLATFLFHANGEITADEAEDLADHMEWLFNDDALEDWGIRLTAKLRDHKAEEEAAPVDDDRRSAVWADVFKRATERMERGEPPFVATSAYEEPS